MECAVRETLEEIGLDLSTFDFVGRLNDRPVFTGGREQQDAAYCVGVWVQRAPCTPPLVLQRDEVAEVRWVRLSELLPHRVDWRGIVRPAERFFPWCSILPMGLRRATGLEVVYLPAIHLSAAAESCAATGGGGGSNDPPFTLWGMSLQATSDLLSAAGLMRHSDLAWPPLTTTNPLLNGLVAAWCGAKEVHECLEGRRKWGNVVPVHISALGSLVVGGLALAWRYTV